eukprot:4813748-Pleurochrysis_carterae.AAC.1
MATDSWPASELDEEDSTLLGLEELRVWVGSWNLSNTPPQASRSRQESGKPAHCRDKVANGSAASALQRRVRPCPGVARGCLCGALFSPRGPYFGFVPSFASPYRACARDDSW